MFEDFISDFSGGSAALTITQTTFDKRALCTNDLTSLAISLSNVHYLSIHFPSKLTALLQSNGCLELMVRKIRYLSNVKNGPFSDHKQQKAEIAFSAAIASLACAAACGTAQMRFRIVQAKLIPIVLPILNAACLILDSVHQKQAQIMSRLECESESISRNESGDTTTAATHDFCIANVTHQQEQSSSSSNHQQQLPRNNQNESSSEPQSSNNQQQQLGLNGQNESNSILRNSDTSSLQANDISLNSVAAPTTQLPLAPPQYQPNLHQIHQEDQSHVRQTSNESFYEDSFEEPDDVNVASVKVHDLLMVTKIVAYISKYEVTRTILRQNYPLFYMIENLTVPSVIPEIRKWAGTCLRNAVRISNSTVMEKRCGLITCPNIVHVEGTYSCNHCRTIAYCRYVVETRSSSYSIIFSSACKEFAWELHQHWCSVSGTCQSTSSRRQPGF